IIPINDANPSFSSKDKDERGFILFPHSQDGNSDYQLYEDDGVSANYQENHAMVNVSMKSTAEKIQVKLNVQGTYELPYSTVHFYVNGDDQREVIVNGQQVMKQNGSYEVQL